MHRALCLVSLFVLAALGGCKRHGTEAPALQRSGAEEARLFHRCQELIARDLHYPGELGGEGKAIQDRGIRSFLVKGPHHDFFSCEIYPDGSYHILAALGGKLPFKPVSKGKL